MHAFTHNLSTYICMHFFTKKKKKNSPARAIAATEHLCESPKLGVAAVAHHGKCAGIYETLESCPEFKLNTQVWVDNLIRELPSYHAECMEAPLAHGMTQMLRLSDLARAAIPTGRVLAPRRTAHYACTTLVCAH